MIARLVILLAALSLLVACGGASTPPEEERPARWTSGDDAPLDQPHDAHGDEEAAGDRSRDAR